MANSSIEWTEPDTIERFWSYVEKAEGNACWIWKGGLFDKGYGQFRVKSKKVKAHKFAFVIANGDIPSGLLVCHSCDNPPCVRPSHLFAGTHKQNSGDRDRKGRRSPHLPPALSGEENHSAKLNWGAVREIRSLYRKMLNIEIAKKYGISPSQVTNIMSGHSWRENNVNKYEN